MSDTKNWRLDFIEDIAVLTLDVPQQSANVLSHDVVMELDQRRKRVFLLMWITQQVTRQLIPITTL